MSDEDHGLLAMEASEVIVAFLLELSVADGENFIENENVALSADGDRESEANLHAGRVIFELGVHEGLELSEADDFVVHGVHFFMRKAEESAIEIDIFTAGKLRVKADTELDEGDEVAINFDTSLLWVIDLGEELEKGGFAGAVAADDADELALFDIEADAAQDLVLGVAFDAFEPVKDSLLKPGGTLGRETEALVEVSNLDGDF